MRAFIKKIWWWFLGFIIIGGSLGIISSSFSVSNVECSLNGQNCPDPVNQSLTTFHQKALFFYDFRFQIQSQLDQDGEYQVTHLTKKLPHTLVIKLETTPPQYQFVSTSNDRYIVNQAGKMRKADQVASDLPIVISLSPTTSSEQTPFVSPAIHQFILTTIQELKHRQIGFQELKLTSEQQLEVKIDQNLTAYLDHTAPATQIKRLELILKSRPFAVPITVVDVRYKLPVLK